MIRCHMMMKQRFPGTPPAYGRAYDGIKNLRLVTKAAVEAFMAWQPKK